MIKIYSAFSPKIWILLIIIVSLNPP
jgi:hypothetical protein